jgi:sterol desaturase/sphingolipid hydroxylase (fatty acid hydroxylase superfamily)
MTTLINYAIPVFVLSMWLENRIGVGRGLRLYERNDTRAGVLLGFGLAGVNLGFDVLFAAFLFAVYEHRIFTLEPTVLAWVSLVFAEDLSYYWAHRMCHEVRFMWAAHVTHHSSQRYNFSTAVRQSWTQGFVTFVFRAPLAWLGFHPLMIITQMMISLFYQFFVHTTLVNKLGPLEWVMNTPSHHRVHHAVNVRYLDRNHAGIFIVWDRLFGTFAEERSDDVPVYGITKNVETYNPVTLAFHEWVALVHDVRRARSAREALGYVFMPPGWSPDGSTLTAKQMRAGSYTR